jgi:hypothetical protein
MMWEVHQCLANFPAERGGSVSALYYAYYCSFTMITQLDDDPRSGKAFTEACRVFHMTARNFSVSLGLLRGLMALSKQLNIRLPEESLPYFDDVRLQEEISSDVPISYLVPKNSRTVELLQERGKESEDIGFELGAIIANAAGLWLESD